MPQTFNVLKCYKCHTFQVHQEKKSNKWCCKVCNEKQSVKQVYGSGSGYDCRQHVQKLNMLKGEAEDFKKSTLEALDDQDPTMAFECGHEDDLSSEIEEQAKRQPSKWEKFMDDKDIENLGIGQLKPAEKVPILSIPSTKKDVKVCASQRKSFLTQKRDDDPFKITTDIDFDL